MKILFLAALIITYVKAVTEVPSSLLGTWDLSSTTCQAQANVGCIQSVNFATSGSTTLLLTFTAVNSNSCGNGQTEEQQADDVEVNDSLSSNSFVLTVEESDDSEQEYQFELSGKTLTLTFDGADCNMIFTNSANLMKATIVGVIAVIAAIMVV